MIKIFITVLFLLFSTFAHSVAQTPAPDKILITLERHPGHWGEVGADPCPFYKLTIFDNGSVELEPKNYDDNKIVIGKTIKSQINSEQLTQLIAWFKKIDFYSLKSTFEDTQKNSREDCPQYGTDGVNVKTSIMIDGKTKLVEHYHGCQKTEILSKLTDLENTIGEAVNIKQWFDCFEGKNLKVLFYPIEHP